MEISKEVKNHKPTMDQNFHYDEYKLSVKGFTQLEASNPSWATSRNLLTLTPSHYVLGNS